jgi:hypothetical protein
LRMLTRRQIRNRVAEQLVEGLPIAVEVARQAREASEEDGLEPGTSGVRAADQGGEPHMNAAPQVRPRPDRPLSVALEVINRSSRIRGCGYEPAVTPQPGFRRDPPTRHAARVYSSLSPSQ